MARPAHTYRAARRNEWRNGSDMIWRGVPSRYVEPAPVRLNRSAKLPRAKSYAVAAKIAAINARP